MPMLPQPPSQSETLLFNDIMEEKILSLRNLLNEFLQVQPYHTFNVEFNNFLKHIKNIIQEVQRSGANTSRITNSSQIASLYPQPSASFNNGLYTPMSMTSSNTSNRTSMFRVPRHSFRPIEPINPSIFSTSQFKPPVNNFASRVEVPRIEQSMYNAHESPTYASVIEANQVENETAQTNNVHRNYLPFESQVQPQSAIRNSYSNETVIENRSASSLHQIYENDENNSVESLLEGAGFKIFVGLPDQSEQSQNTTKCNASQLKNKEKVNENIEKYLSTWSVNMKIIKSHMNSSKVVILLTGTLLGKDRVTVIEKQHKAGFLESRKENNLVKTNKGLYRLIDNIIGGYPNDLYKSCVSLKGIPRSWRNIVKQYSSVEKTTQNALLNFSLDSPARPASIQPKKNTPFDTSLIREGTINSNNMSVPSQKTNGKRKTPVHDEREYSKNKHCKYHKQDSKILNTANDSIHITKKQQSISREQTSIYLKQKEHFKTSLSNNNNTKRSRQSTENSPVRSINKSIITNLSKQASINKNQSKQTSKIENQSKQTSINVNQSTYNLKLRNNSNKSNCSLCLHSTIKPSKKSARISNNTEQECKFISSLNSTENSLKKSNQNIPKIDNKPIKVVKAKNIQELAKLVKNKMASPRITS